MIPDISFIVPVYNAKDYLDKCISSIIEQTHNNIEVLLVDDGSDDGSDTVCDRYGEMDERVKVFHAKNKGVSVARNTGIENSFGKWISFVDADDYLNPDFAKNMLKESEQHNADIIASNYVLERENQSVEQYFFSRCIDFACDDIYKYLVIDSILGSNTKTNIGVPWGKLYRREFIISNQLSFMPGLKRMQDSLFNAYAFSKAENVYFFNACLYHYRQWKNSAVHKYTPDFEKTCMDLLDEYARFFKEIGVEDSTGIINIKKIQLYYELLRVDICHKQNNSSLHNKIKRIRACSKNLPDIYQNKYIRKLRMKHLAAYYMSRLHMYYPLYFGIRLYKTFI